MEMHWPTPLFLDFDRICAASLSDMLKHGNMLDSTCYTCCTVFDACRAYEGLRAPAGMYCKGGIGSNTLCNAIEAGASGVEMPLDFTVCSDTSS